MVEHSEGALLAAIVDANNILWCWSKPLPPLSDRWGDVVPLTDAFHANEIAKLSPPLRRGRQLSIARQPVHIESPRGYLRLVDGIPPSWRSYVAESFAGLYVVVVWFRAGVDLAPHRELVREALPKIAALTAVLPPPDGPDASAGAMKSRA